MPLILSRRLLFGRAIAGAALGPAGLARAEVPGPGGRPLAPAAFVSLPVWPEGPPGGVPAGLLEREIPRSPTGPADDTAFLHVTAPALICCRPARPNGAAILLVPGGSYARVAIGRGGADLLRGFAALGFAAYLLKYRLPGDPWAAGPDTPLQDAQRALRLIRSRAAQDGFDPARIAVWGGSAGGHLAARLVNQRQPVYASRDAIDAQPLGASAAVLLYPVNLLVGPFAHQPSHDELLRQRPDLPADAYAAEASVHAGSPPTLLAHALDDKVVAMDNSLSYLAALRRNAIASELYVPEHGGHGFGWKDAAGVPLAWTGLARDFLQRHLALTG